jgi:opacity protein-like surface antigen
MKEMSMKVLWKVSGLAGLGALLMNALPASAQVQANSQEVDAYVGALFGDDITDRRINGQRPHVTRFGPNDTGANLWAVDVDAVWHILPEGPIVPYVLAGVGWGALDLDRDLVATQNGITQTIRDDNGVTLNAGFGAKWYATEHLLFRAEARYRWMDKVVDRFDQSLNTVETTVGIGYQF